jgi:hypothetical protein
MDPDKAFLKILHDSGLWSKEVTNRTYRNYFLILLISSPVVLVILIYFIYLSFHFFFQKSKLLIMKILSAKFVSCNLNIFHCRHTCTADF